MHCDGRLHSEDLNIDISRRYSNLVSVLMMLRRALFSGVHRRFNGSRSYKTRHGCFGYIPQTKNRVEAQRIIDANTAENRNINANLVRLVTAYREHGYKNADLDPLKIRSRESSDLNPALFGIDNIQPEKKYDLRGVLNIAGMNEANMNDIIQHLNKTYCQTISAEFSHIKDEEERGWFASKMEESSSWIIDEKAKIQIAIQMLKSQTFDQFVGKKFKTLKRYSGEGAESMIAFCSELFNISANYGIMDIVMCIPHRGRLNLLTGLLDYPHAQMFSKMKGNPEFPHDLTFTGDVLSHLYSSTDVQCNESKLHVSMLPNPSHLEAINPVTVGKARAKQLVAKEGHYGDETSSTGDKVLCLQVHGDAAIAAQGIVMETLCLASLPHYNIGGSVHLIVNNQLGFTTPAERASSAMNCSDILKFIDCPVIHVNGDNPEDVLRACRIAMGYRMKYRKDVLVNLFCFRKWGHNEIDDPTFTNPSMYRIINDRISVPDLYAEKITNEGIVTKSHLNDEVSTYNEVLSNALAVTEKYHPKHVHFKRHWSSCQQAQNDVITNWDTGCPADLLRFVGSKSVATPDDFNIHPHLRKTHCEARLEKILHGKNIDWATAEALAFGSLLYEGCNVRLSGQDVGRGTFSHRHCMLIDQDQDEMIVPLNHMSETQTAFLEVANSPLSEEAVLGFEYGMSINNPKDLIIWEAQFGDFFNGAQIIIDTFITAGETKWILQSGLVLLLPHGYDGAGPEHSSCRLERFLQLSDSKEDGIDGDNVNFSIVHPTNAAQYYHLLRRQVVRNFRKPLVVAAPKLILRMTSASSTIEEMTEGTHFKPIIQDSVVNPNDVKKIIFCCGKHYYELEKQRRNRSIKDTAIIRIEELVPFPTELLKAELAKYPNAKDFIWCQEEHRNMGAWFFVNPRFENLLNVKLTYCGRRVLGVPAVGIGSRHGEEAEQIMNDAFK